MFLKITRSGPRQYLQLVEAFRDDAGKAKHRTLVTLGRLDQLTDSLDSVISGLLKVTGRPDFLNASLPPVEFESARALGNVWALNELWESLGFGNLRRVFRKTRHSIDVEALIRIMVFNRLCDPDSKLGVLRWLETVATLKAWMGATHFLTRTMDRVSTGMSLHVLAYNLKRVMKIIGIGALMEVVQA